MRPFEHINAKTLEEAKARLAEKNAIIIAGGTDLVPGLKDNFLPQNLYTTTIVSIKTIPGLTGITRANGAIIIGALTTLADIANSPIVLESHKALAEAAGRTASPNLRNMATLGGSLCQLNRCWYFRKPENRFFCARKGGGECYAKTGDDRFHSIFTHAGNSPCYAPLCSDTATALAALDASVVTDKRTIPIEDFFAIRIPGNTILENDEIILEIRIPGPEPGSKNTFLKIAWRKSIDFPVVNCAVLTGDSPRIFLGAVAPVPIRVLEAEKIIAGKIINEKLATEAGEASVIEAKPTEATRYKLQLIKTLVKRALI